MTAPTTTSRRPRVGVTLRDRGSRARDWLRRACNSPGAERENVVIVGKSALAAWLAWAVAQDLMAAKSPAFAPFSAVWMMQVTVYQSVVQSLRYVSAVIAGVGLQALFGFFVGPDLLTFALVAVGALTIGRWRRLGAQGPQVATAAFFAFSTYLAATTVNDRIQQLWQLIVLVLVGSAIGVAVNLLVLPPMRYRNAEYGVRAVAHALTGILEDLGPALRDRELDSDRTGRWRDQAGSLRRTVDQARSSVTAARESGYYNPRRLLRRNRHQHQFRGYEAVVDALDRVSHQVGSLVRALGQEWDDEPLGDRDFLRRYGDYTDCLVALTRLLGEIDESRLPAQLQELRDRLGQAETAHARLVRSAEHLDTSLTAGTTPYGILLVEAVRLYEEFRHTADILADSFPPAVRPRR